MALETETRFFDKNRQAWIKDGHEGEWVVVHGEELLGFFPTIEDGYGAGIKRFGAGKFLLRQLKPQDDVETIQRVHWGHRVAQQPVKR